MEYEDVFKGLGCIAKNYKIHLKDDVKPVIHAPRKVPVSLREKLHQELQRCEKMGVIEKISEPTEWVNSLVLVPKANGTVRICIDPKDLNQAIKRQQYPLPTIADIRTRLTGATVFSVLDAASGFWQIELDDESAKLCTFNSPFGRYCFRRLPFGVTIGSEAFQQKVSEIFEGLEGVEIYIDDILVWGKDEREHDERLEKVLQRCREANLKLNKEKARIAVDEVTYVGHRISKEGTLPDEKKVKAIMEMPKPQNKKDIERFLGLVQYVGKFIPNLSDITSPIRHLMKQETEWQWSDEQDKAVETIKKLITSAPTLKHYDPQKELTISADASKDGIGAVLLQEGSPIEYAARSMTEAETRYAQIEKELLAMVFAAKRFHQYIYGRKVNVESDHKPLEAIFKKELNKAPPRLQRLLLAMQKYEVDVKYTPGKYMYVADALSRAAVEKPSKSEIECDDDVEIHIQEIRNSVPMSDNKWQEMKEEIKKDAEIQQVIQAIQDGWPEKEKCRTSPYWPYKEELFATDGVVFKGNQLVIPRSQRKEMLKRLHAGHQGVVNSKIRAKESMFWPGMISQIEDMILRCSTCIDQRPQNSKETLITHDIPGKPWIKLGSDMFQYNGEHYLIVVDYCSKFFEIAKLNEIGSSEVIMHMKSIFARHGIPREIITDNGPQYSSAKFKEFTRAWDIKHVTSSPHYPQSNGMAEKHVGVAKNILRKAARSGSDPYIGLLEYRATPKPDGIPSPAEVLMGRKLTTLLPYKENESRQEDEMLQKLKARAEEMKRRHDKGAKDLSVLQPGQCVRVKTEQKDNWIPAVVKQKLPGVPRSYELQTSKGVIRRNRRHILKTTEKFSVKETIPPNRLSSEPLTITPNKEAVKPADSSNVLTTRSGRHIHRPKYLNDYVLD